MPGTRRCRRTGLRLIDSNVAVDGADSDPGDLAEHEGSELAGCGLDAQVAFGDPHAVFGCEQLRQCLPVNDLEVYPVVLARPFAQFVTGRDRDVLFAEEVHTIHLAAVRDRAQVILDLRPGSRAGECTRRQSGYPFRRPGRYPAVVLAYRHG